MRKVLLLAFVASIGLTDPAFSAVSCTPGLSYIIGTEYVADKCSYTGPPYNYIATDLQCVNGTVQKHSGYSYNYYGQTPESFQAAILYSAAWLNMKIFRNTEGTQFITVNRYYAWGGQIDGVNLGSYSSAPSVHYDVFEPYFFPPPSVPDEDGDGYYICDDCNDNDPDVNPGAAEVCDDGKDNDCNGQADCFDDSCEDRQDCCIDDDEDGYAIDGGSCGDIDCNDNDPDIYPGALEICDGRDNDCDDLVDEDLSWDRDDDGHYAPRSCKKPDDDCNDHDSTVYPGAPELCTDWKDNDCDGEVNEGCCDLAIESFDGGDTEIDRSTGGSIFLKGAISDSSGKPVVWEISVGGRRFAGSGKSPSANWDGRYPGGKVVGIGTHSASIHAERTDKPDCGDGDSVEFTVFESTSPCKLQVDFGSSAHVAGGELRDRLNLFSYPGNPAIELDLHYRSLDMYDGPLGIGWQHSFDIFLSENDFGEIILKQGDGSYLLYKPNGDGTFRSQAGDFSILEEDPEGGWVRARKNGLRQDFGSGGELIAQTDRNGNALIFTYEDGLLREVADDSGRNITFTYNGNGKLDSISDPAGSVYNFTVGETLESVTLPDGATWNYAYTDNAYLTEKIDPLGNVTDYGYDEEYRVISAVDPKGQMRSIDYPRSAEPIRSTLVTEKDGGIWTYVYDIRSGNLHEKADPEGNVTRYTYDENHNLLTKTDPSGTTVYTYDAAGNMTSVIDPLGQTTTYTYNAFGQLLSISEPDGNVTAYEYDEKGNLIQITDPADALTTYTYDVQGNVSSVSDSAGTMVMTYDAAGNMTSVTDPAGATTLFEYNAAGRIIRRIDPQGNVTKFEYDTRGNLIRTVDPLGNTTSSTYDALGNEISTTDANGNTTSNSYDSQGQMTERTDAEGNITEFAYGGSGCSSCGGGGGEKMTSLTDANGNTTFFRYDTLGRLIEEIDPLSRITSYAYDARGNLAARTDAKGRTIRYFYDALGRLLKKSYPDGAEEKYSYDAQGNILTAVNQDIGYSFEYNASGRLAGVIDSDGRAIRYAYDAAGRRTEMVAPDGKAILYEYDEAGGLSAILNGGDFLFDHDSLGRRKSLEYPNGATAEYAYDAAGRLISLMHLDPTGEIIAQSKYIHDNVGNRTGRITEKRTTAYDYDRIYQLLEAVQSTPGFSAENGKGKKVKGISRAVENQKEFYDYDPVGNRTVSSEHKSYSHNVGNQLLTADGTIYRYDVNGNMIEKIEDEGTTTYAWDYENRLTRVNTPEGTIVEFRYDPFGRRIEKKVTDREGTRITRYLYDNEDILYTYDEEGQITSRFVHGPGIDEPLAVNQGKKTYYYHSDGLGSVVALTDDRGRVVQEYEYDSYGSLHDRKNRIKQPYTYTGREYDRKTGLYYYRARYYDAEVGRFVSEDPIGFAGEDFNLYRLVKNDPINFVDPDGLWRSHPRYGNWGGAGWSGGDAGNAPPVDSLDECFRDHDLCYAGNNGCDSEESECDNTLVKCLYNLKKNPLDWDKRPKDPIYANFYRTWAIGYYD